MTAVNAFIRGNAAYLFTDGKTYTMDGDAQGQSQKAEIFAHLPAVITARGHSWIRSAMGFHMAERFRDFDHTVQGIEDLLRKTRKGLNIPANEAVLELTLVGWSRRRRDMEIYSLSDANRPGVPAFTLHKVDGVVSPLDDRMMRDIEAAGLDIEEGEPEATGLALLRMQRDRIWPIQSNGRMVSTVGAFAQMTVVRPDRIETRILERWDDAA